MIEEIKIYKNNKTVLDWTSSTSTAISNKDINSLTEMIMDLKIELKYMEVIVVSLAVLILLLSFNLYIFL